MFAFSMPELILVLVIALVVFGPGKLPDVGKALGKSLQEFRRATIQDHTSEPIKVLESVSEKKA
jgi:sec-independent protein translocase protein TatA